MYAMSDQGLPADMSTENTGCLCDICDCEIPSSKLPQQVTIAPVLHPEAADIDVAEVPRSRSSRPERRFEWRFYHVTGSSSTLTFVSTRLSSPHVTYVRLYTRNFLLQSKLYPEHHCADAHLCFDPCEVTRAISESV